MKRNTLNKLFLIGCLLVMVSCKAKKLALAGTAPAVSPTSATTVTQAAAPPVVMASKPDSRMDAVKSSQLFFNTFAAKAAANLDINGDKNDVDITIRIDHNKKIWVSVTKNIFVTVDVARAVITPDSIMTIDKIHGTYLKKPFSYLYQFANSQVNYKMLEAILTGNALPEITKDNNASFLTDNGSTTISGTLESLVYNLMLGQDMKVTKLNLSDHNAGQSLQVSNNGFIPMGSKMMPEQIDIQSIAKNKKFQVNLHYTKVDLDQPLQYPFTIPDRYTPTDGN